MSCATQVQHSIKTIVSMHPAITRFKSQNNPTKRHVVNAGTHLNPKRVFESGHPMATAQLPKSKHNTNPPARISSAVVSLRISPFGLVSDCRSHTNIFMTLLQTMFSLKGATLDDNLFEDVSRSVDRFYDKCEWFEPQWKRTPWRFYALLICMKRLGVALPRGLRRHIWDNYERFMRGPEWHQQQRDQITIEWQSIETK